MFGCFRPVSAFSISMGMRDLHSWPLILSPPFVAGNPFPCWSAQIKFKKRSNIQREAKYCESNAVRQTHSELIWRDCEKH